MKNKKELIIGGVILVAIILIVVLFVAFGGKGKDNENNNTNETPVEDNKITDDDVEKAYGFSSQDAINLVKTIINSDAFDYSTEVNSESKYVVTVKSKVDDTVLKFEVDPVTKSFYEIQ